MPEGKEKGIGQHIVSVLNGMAQGLFASLIIGLIIKQIGTYAGIGWLSYFGQVAQYLTGPSIGIGVAWSIGAKGLSLFAAAAAGAIGAGTVTIDAAGTAAIASGEPLGACIAALAGAAVVESLFAIPGLGQLMVNSIGRRDYYVIQSIVLLIAVFNVLVTMLIDIVYGLVDPRVRYGGR